MYNRVVKSMDFEFSQSGFKLQHFNKTSLIAFLNSEN